ncbi:MAG TPA: type II toxin-antitoxin system VapC family toxin [Thermoanaerobaculia bacterium]|nr:type II toxin-antitoxin system VapC family toxin [Thermoanaerobaculia bacterium]
MTGLDTNVLVRYFTRDDVRQFRVADALFAELSESGGDAFVNVVVLCELAWVLDAAYGFAKPTIVDVFRRILDTAQLVVEDRDLVAEAVEQFAKGQASFADYLIGVRNRAAGCGVTATFDRALRGAAGFRFL